MGVFDFLRRLILGPEQVPQPPSSSDAPDRTQEPEAQSSAVPSPSPAVVEVKPVPVPPSPPTPQRLKPKRVKEKPYALALFRGGRYLDRRVGQDLERLHKFSLPQLETPEQIASRFDLSVKKLAWIADYHRSQKDERARKKQHYRYIWKEKRNKRGHRLIEAPKTTLKGVQKRILAEILDRVPPHASAHAFVSNRSIMTNAEAHAGRQTILKLDLADFYPSVTYPRVRAIFRGIGYGLEAAHWLASLTTNMIPRDLKPPVRDPDALMPYPTGKGHLPQGAPTSPALANLAAFGLDVRLSALARKLGLTYTRYADDLTFSCDAAKLSGRLARFRRLVRRIVASEGFKLNESKSRLFRPHQRQTVTGLTVNAKPNVSRAWFDRLKATLHNAARYGTNSQNRDRHKDFKAYLQGQIAFARSVNPKKAERLQRAFDEIRWW